MLIRIAIELAYADNVAPVEMMVLGLTQKAAGVVTSPSCLIVKLHCLRRCILSATFCVSPGFSLEMSRLSSPPKKVKS